jgi:hypothetical protein
LPENQHWRQNQRKRDQPNQRGDGLANPWHDTPNVQGEESSIQKATRLQRR